MQIAYADSLKKPNQNVGAGLPAIATCQLIQLQLTHRHRRQASSHIDRASPETFTQAAVRETLEETDWNATL